VIDTNVLVLREYPRDRDWPANEDFVARLPALNAAVPIYAVLEFLGIASYRHNVVQLLRMRDRYLLDELKLTVLRPKPSSAASWEALHDEVENEPFEFMSERKMSYGDAQILRLAEGQPESDEFVTWNARHFQGKTRLDVLTPAEYMTKHGFA
jgi:hypothetical protein